jgi:hypothetical protein
MFDLRMFVGCSAGCPESLCSVTQVPSGTMQVGKRKRTLNGLPSEIQVLIMLVDTFHIGCLAKWHRV